MDTVELSVEETNKLREKLGLKPLRVTNTSTQNKKHEKAKEEGEGEGTPSVSVKEKLLAMRQDRLAAASAKKEAEEKARVVTLGTKQSEDDDDMKAWIQKSRKLEKEKAKALKTQQALLQQEEFDGGDAAAAAAAAGGGGGGGGNGNGNGNRKRRRGGGKGNSSYNAQSLGGLKIGHKADDFQQGTQVVLTLKDQGVLDDCGELQTGEDVLEDTLLAQQEKQAEALERSKPKSRYEEEEEEEDKKTVLAKYDDPKKASTSTYMEIDASGQVGKAQLEAQAEMSRKLKQGIHYGKLKESADPMKRALDDFWTPEELTSMQQEKGGGKGKGKKRRRKKNKNIRMKKKDIDDLEAQAQAEEEAAGAEDKNKTHHGKRVQGMKTKQTQESYLNEQARRDAAYSEALSKAAEKTAAMVESTQQMQTDQATLENFEEEEDNEFFSALTRARESALSRQRKADVSTALQQAKNLSKEDASTSLYRGEIFTEASEFCNSISAKDHESTTPAEKQEGLLPGEKSQDKVKEENTQQEQQSTSASGSASKVATNAPAAAVLGEARIDKGIGAALRMLQDRGELRKTVRWSGRTNDMRDNNVRDVIESYNDETQFAQDIESALTRKDEFGRVMTPKEAFRQLCYKFHGIKASKNKQEKRIKKYLEEQKILQKNNTK